MEIRIEDQVDGPIAKHEREMAEDCWQTAKDRGQRQGDSNVLKKMIERRG